MPTDNESAAETIRVLEKRITRLEEDGVAEPTDSEGPPLTPILRFADAADCSDKIEFPNGGVEEVNFLAGTFGGNAGSTVGDLRV